MKRFMLMTAMLAMSLISALTVAAQMDMRVTVSNIPNSEGTILIATKSGQWAKVKAEKGKIETVINNVPAGKGTIYVFHDENDNKQLDKKDNIPTEYCAFGDYDLNEKNSNVSIELIYVPDKMKEGTEKAK